MENDTLRKFGPKPMDFDPEESPPCAACKQQFKPGDHSTLVLLGPGDDPSEQLKCREGRPYNSLAVEVHWACATGEVR